MRIEPQEGLPSLRPTITKLLVSDRALYEGSSKAFVAYLRAYKEHQCSYIFQVEHLDLGELARALAVLRLPKLRELGSAAQEGRRGRLGRLVAACGGGSRFDQV